MKNKIHINRDYGWFIGGFDHNQSHKHYAIQFSIPLRHNITVKTPHQTITTKQPLLIRPQVEHRLTSSSAHFLLLINPASTIGHYWHALIKDEVEEFTTAPATELQAILSNPALNPAELHQKINALIMAHDCFCTSFIHQGDERINKALDYLQKNPDRPVPLDEIAQHCHVSPGRFLHLFKEKTGITYRRAQLWARVVNAMLLLGAKSLTKVAHEVGFSDSAHLSRTFRENFGFSPREFLKISRFIQV